MYILNILLHIKGGRKKVLLFSGQSHKVFPLGVVVKRMATNRKKEKT